NTSTFSTWSWRSCGDAASASRLQLPHRPRCLLQVEGCGIERPPPLQHFLMLLVFRVRDGGEIIDVAPRSATILRWAGPFSFQAEGIFRLGIARWKPLEQHIVPPAVAEIVLVDPARPATRPGDETAQKDTRFIKHVASDVEVIKSRRPVPFAVDVELVQVV